jgi:hypothetical protein
MDTISKTFGGASVPDDYLITYPEVPFWVSNGVTPNPIIA